MGNSAFFVSMAANLYSLRLSLLFPLLAHMSKRAEEPKQLDSKLSTSGREENVVAGGALDKVIWSCAPNVR